MPASGISFIHRLTRFRVGLVALCLALSACASTGRKLVDMPEPVSSLRIAVDERPRMGWRGIDRSSHDVMNFGLGLYMKEIERTISPTFSVSNVPVTVSALHELGNRIDERYVLILQPINVDTFSRGNAALPSMRSIDVEATLMYVPSKLAVWSYVFGISGNPASFSRATLQPLADEMVAQNIISAAQRSAPGN